MIDEILVSALDIRACEVHPRAASALQAVDGNRRSHVRNQIAFYSVSDSQWIPWLDLYELLLCDKGKFGSHHEA